MSYTMEAVLDRAYLRASTSSRPPSTMAWRHVMTAPGFVDATVAAGAWLANGQDLRAERTLVRAVSALSGLAAGASGTLELLFIVFKEALREDAATKRYWLEKLGAMDAMSEHLAEHLQRLAKASRGLPAVPGAGTRLQASGSSDGRPHRLRAP